MIFSIVELAIAAHFTSLTQQYLSATATFCSLGLAVGAISLVTLPVMLVAAVKCSFWKLTLRSGLLSISFAAEPLRR